MRTTCTLFTVLAILSTLAANPAMAKDDPLEFLHLLQSEGYADMAVDYLDQIKTDPNAPKEIMDLWDLEMSKSKQEKIKQAYSDTEAKQLAEESKALLERFIKAHPNRPEAIQEAAKLSEERALEGQYLVLRANYTADKDEKAKLLADARKIFEDIRPRFLQALEASAKLLDSLPPKPSPRRENAVIMVGESRLTVAMVDFYLAQTQPDGPERTAALTKTMKEFDAIYQDFRAYGDSRKAFLALRAHFWNGRLLQELGNANDAKIIFEEVAAGDPLNIEDVAETKGAARTKAAVKKTGLEDFFADVEQYYLKTLYQVSQKDYLEEVKTWRAVHKAASEKCFGYQALTLEYAKHCLESGAKSKSESDKRAATREALRLLAEMAKVASPYRQDAMKLQRQLNPNASADSGFEDAVTEGDAAIEKKNWAAAIKSYEKALDAKTDKTDEKRLADVKNTLVGCYHNQAMQLYQKKKAEDAILTAKKALKREYLQTKAAPGLAVFLLNVLYYQYMDAPDNTAAEKQAKSELLTKVSNTAKSILNIKDWAAKEEGDAARIVLLRLALAEDKVADADKILSDINPSSKEYPKALTVMGFAHWFKYRTAKKQMEADKKLAVDKERIAKRDDDRKQAVDYTTKAVQSLGTLRTADAAVPETLRECQLLLAEIYSEGEDFKQAASLYKPLIDDIVKDSSKPLDETGLRIFSGAGQAYLKLGDAENVTAVITRLLERGPDQGPVNRAIMSFAMGLEKGRKKALTETDPGDPIAQDAAAAKMKSLTDLQEKVMINLSKREKFSSNEMIWIVKTASNMGTDDAIAAAANLIEKIFDKANNDQDFENEITKAAASLHALGASLQGRLGHYEKAKEQIDAVIEKYPRALDPRVSEAKILTEWASKDPSKYGAAIGKWDTLRKKLERISANADPKTSDPKKIDPKYDVILNEADCFYRMSQKTKSKEDAKTGLDLLAPYLNLDPNIRAPRDEFKELSVRYFQLGGKLAEFLGLPRPVRPKIKRTP